jgi:hypothetical protein
MTTPDFPAWASALADQLQEVRVRGGATLHQFEALFAPWIPAWRLAPQEEGDHSRQRLWPLRLVFWTFLWQVAQAGSACREAILQARSLCEGQGHPLPPDKTSPYCQARASLPLERLDEIFAGIVQEADQGIATQDLWCGHRVQVVDGSTVTLPDTPDNQAAYPQQKSQQPGCGFPIMRVVARFSLATGMLTQWATGYWRQHELGLWQTMWEQLRPDDVLLGDRGFGVWAVLAQCVARGLHGVFRSRRKIDFRGGQRLNRHERLVSWPKPQLCPSYLTPAQWAALPPVLTLRVVRCQLKRQGFRTRQVTLVTTLLDSVRYPVAALAELYYRRWEVELSLRNLKTTLQMEHLSCKTPANVERELRMHFLIHNLVRRLMLEASRRHHVPWGRLSFAGALAVARRYGEALLQVPSARKRARLMEQLYRVLAADQVPDRPGRREPRAVKRRPKPYPRLMCHRRRFKEVPHPNRYWNGSPCKRKKLKNIRP